MCNRLRSGDIHLERFTSWKLGRFKLKVLNSELSDVTLAESYTELSFTHSWLAGVTNVRIASQAETSLPARERVVIGVELRVLINALGSRGLVACEYTTVELSFVA